MSDIDIYFEKDICICTINDNKIKFESAFDLSVGIKKLINEQNYKSLKILLDFINLEFIDSNGIAFLMLLKNKIEDLNGQFVIINAAKDIYSSLSLIGIEKLFNFFDNKDIAIEFLNN